jgi:hypothetical protein
VDVAGRVGDATGTRFDVAADEGAPDTAAPDVVLTTPQGNEELDGRPATLSGEASDDTGIAAVDVAVKDQSGTLWWDPAAARWGPYRWTEAELTEPGATSTGWSFDFDDTAALGSGGYFVRVRARDEAGNASDVTGRRFTIH